MLQEVIETRERKHIPLYFFVMYFDEQFNFEHYFPGGWTCPVHLCNYFINSDMIYNFIYCGVSIFYFFKVINVCNSTVKRFILFTHNYVYPLRCLLSVNNRQLILDRLLTRTYLGIIEFKFGGKLFSLFGSALPLYTAVMSGSQCRLFLELRCVGTI